MMSRLGARGVSRSGGVGVTFSELLTGIVGERGVLLARPYRH